tara:strand:+ start:2350 stop:2646 length:297 start_codon:yes stop_codon:yes gene_type:complete
MEILEIAGCEIVVGVEPDKVFFATTDSIYQFMKNLDKEGLVSCVGSKQCTKVFYNRNIDCPGVHMQKLKKAYNATSPDPHFQSSLDRIYDEIKSLALA